MLNKNTDIKIRAQVDALGRPTIEMLNREIAWHERKESYRRLARGVLLTLITSMAAIILATNLWVSVLQIDGSSMNPLLEMDEIVLAAKGNNPQKKDVIAFYHNNKLFIKRVIATAGDRVEIKSNGAVFVNGTSIDEPYVADPSLGHCDISFPYQVPAGTVFVLGDNRGASTDSRDSRFGPIPREQIAGKVVFRIWPLSRTGKIA